MDGIYYLTDKQNKRKFVQIDIEKYGEDLLDDVIEGLVAESRKQEESVPLEDVLEELRSEGKIDG